MPSVDRLRGLDDQAWRVATLSAPFVAPALLGVMIAILWLLGKLPVFEIHERAWYLSGTVVTGIASLATGLGLLASRSSQLRGVAASIVGSSVIVTIGSFVYFLALRW